MPRLHVGKNWPLAVRRDYNLHQQTNSAGFAAQYDFGMSLVGGPVGTWLETNTIRIKEHDPNSSQFARWSSAPTFANGRLITCSMECSDAGDDGYMRTQWVLSDSILGKLVGGTALHTLHFVYGVLGSTLQPTEFLHPAILNSTHFFSGASFDYVPW